MEPWQLTRAQFYRSETRLASIGNLLYNRPYFTSKPSSRKHILCASMSFLQSGSSSPLKTTHSSRAFLVSGQQQQMGLPVLIPSFFFGLSAGGGAGVEAPCPMMIYNLCAAKLRAKKDNVRKRRFATILEGKRYREGADVAVEWIFRLKRYINRQRLGNWVQGDTAGATSAFQSIPWASKGLIERFKADIIVKLTLFPTRLHMVLSYVRPSRTHVAT